ncbi:hypothetical protein KG112_06915 [Nocardioides sp. zg-ZUI104]|uniref:hypothetical protein n=1 Tax=Nocardioides faecalis TaxID=2803858 RepID=UPI001BCB4870|nr:hypothetical protein [Nocardioides faecalis]MBS4752538.1 hypothetical protein [Nocardioides faecalis]
MVFSTTLAAISLLVTGATTSFGDSTTQNVLAVLYLGISALLAGGAFRVMDKLMKRR